jgi:hypothetical protein
MQEWIADFSVTGLGKSIVFLTEKALILEAFLSLFEGFPENGGFSTLYGSQKMVLLS